MQGEDEFTLVATREDEIEIQINLKWTFYLINSMQTPAVINEEIACMRCHIEPTNVSAVITSCLKLKKFPLRT